MIDWKKEKDNLERLIRNGVSYTEIGKIYGCCDSNVRKQAIKLGIELPKRRKINPNETFNRGLRRKTCKYCGKDISKGKFCSRDCLNKFNEEEKIKRWLSGENFVRGEHGSRPEAPDFIRRYLFREYDCKCQKCRWGETNESTGLIPLTIHHIDGDCTNNLRENLELLCPNCHSLTNNYGRLNKTSKRKY